MKYIITLLLLTSCTPFTNGLSERERRIDNLKYKQEVPIKKGFYKDCKAILLTRENFYEFKCNLTCNDELIGYNEIIDARDVVEGY